MPLWGVNTTDESRPKWMTPTELRDVTAQKEGWVQYNNNTQKREVLVAVGGLEDALGDPSIADIRVIQNDQAVIGRATVPAGTLLIDVVFNEPITVTNRGNLRLRLRKTRGSGGATDQELPALSSYNTHENVIRFSRTAGSSENGSEYKAAEVKLGSGGVIQYLANDGSTGNAADRTLNSNNSGPDPLLIYATA